MIIKYPSFSIIYQHRLASSDTSSCCFITTACESSW